MTLVLTDEQSVTAASMLVWAATIAAVEQRLSRREYDLMVVLAEHAIGVVEEMGGAEASATVERFAGAVERLRGFVRLEGVT